MSHLLPCGVMVGGSDVGWERVGEDFGEDFLQGSRCSKGEKSLLTRTFLFVGAGVGWERVGEDFR